MLGEVIKLFRIFGVGPIIRKKRAHDTAQPMLRGYISTTCFTTLLNVGFFDALLAKGRVDATAFAREKGLDLQVLGHLIEYLDCIGIVRQTGNGHCVLNSLGYTLLGFPRGSFELTHGYQPILHSLDDLLHGRKVYPDDVQRRGEFIARGSGALGKQLPFPVLREMIVRHGAQRVLDLGAGNLEFLAMLCEGNTVAGRGVEINAQAIAEGRRFLQEHAMAGRIEVVQGDMFNVDPLRQKWPDTDGIVAIDVFHEYILEHRERVVGLLRELKHAWPDAQIFVAEFCKQPHEWLRRHPTSFVEHHLLHNLTKQKILSASEWEALFAEAGLTVVEQTVFSLVGHGYFVLR